MAGWGPLTDRVLPNVPIRQWVLSLPFDLRVPAARDPRLVAACDRVLFEAIQRRMREQLGVARGRAGFVTFVQRFGGSLNLHVHFHVLVLDGLFVRTGKAAPIFVPAPAPTRVDLERVLVEVRDGITAWIAKHDAAADGDEPDALAGCAGIATQRGLFDVLGGKPAPDDDEPRAPGKRSASLDGYNLHAAVRIGADDDLAREKLVRYCARPAFALERLSVLRDGRVAYAIKTARKGATHRILSPVELLARIAALIPPPRVPFLRYHGVLAPASKWRKDIVPRRSEPPILLPAAACDHQPAHAAPPPPTPGQWRDEGGEARFVAGIVRAPLAAAARRRGRARPSSDHRRAPAPARRRPTARGHAASRLGHAPEAHLRDRRPRLPAVPRRDTDRRRDHRAGGHPQDPRPRARARGPSAAERCCGS